MTLLIKNERQKRVVLALLEKKSVQVKDLGHMVGALNPRQSVLELRRQGFEKLILTRRFVVWDRDGKKCLPGEYYMPNELKPLAREALKRYTALKPRTCKAACNSCKNHSSRGEV